MFEYGSYTSLVGSDGTTVMFNSGSGLILTDVSGFDSPNIRTNVQDLPEADGAVAGNSYLGQRPITLTGVIAASDAASRNALIINLQRALRGLRADATLQASPSGLPAMQATGRVVNLRVTGQWLKQFQIQMICQDPRIYSQTLHTSTATQAGTPAAPGASFSWAFPVNWGGGGGAYSVAVNLTNAGNFAAPLILQAGGPITSPQFTDATSGASIYIDGVTVASGQTLTVDTLARTVTLTPGGTNFYQYLRFPGSAWFNLDPGSSTIQLWGTGTSAATALTCQWRDAWV